MVLVGWQLVILGRAQMAVSVLMSNLLKREENQKHQKHNTCIQKYSSSGWLTFYLWPPPLTKGDKK